jgi:hypothetical protein
VIEAIEKVWCCIDEGSVEIENDDGLGIRSDISFSYVKIGNKELLSDCRPRLNLAIRFA